MKSNIQLIIYDFDGVLTNNLVHLNQQGIESVSCNRSDGWWIKQLKAKGINQIIVSTEENPVVTARANKLNIECYQGVANKKEFVLKLLKDKKLELNQVCYIGNDVNDLEIMSALTWTLAPVDSHPQILKTASFILQVKGGEGVVRHIYEWLNTPQQAAVVGTENLADFFTARVNESIAVKQKLLSDKQQLQLISDLITVGTKTLLGGNKIFFAGNGGSHADSVHLAAEFIGRFKKERIPLAAIAMGCNNSSITAIGNDYSYDIIFERELAALGAPGDLLIALSTSGNSKNLIKAINVAREKRINVFALSGATGGQLAKLCSTICVPSSDTARIQECHIMIGHIFCEALEDRLVLQQQNDLPNRAATAD